jgi:hypothetical protein
LLKLDYPVISALHSEYAENQVTCFTVVAKMSSYEEVDSDLEMIDDFPDLEMSEDYPARRFKMTGFDYVEEFVNVENDSGISLYFEKDSFLTELQNQAAYTNVRRQLFSDTDSDCDSRDIPNWVMRGVIEGMESPIICDTRGRFLDCTCPSYPRNRAETCTPCVNRELEIQLSVDYSCGEYDDKGEFQEFRVLRSHIKGPSLCYCIYCMICLYEWGCTIDGREYDYEFCKCEENVFALDFTLSSMCTKCLFLLATKLFILPFTHHSDEN